ncbi:hypothetical protein DSO57_1008008 [Entomophthora muscae]|uniref:Uncharacterized protein n=2 Tax=Entomophthora muscae TaxID=34485 RepID=A0ACC2UGN2_9FUNG|nr:hypothetical protein DSO57_1008007 [Entomophthora muscae]KAJ9086077.1 hypothetical protein DSO57_1008008 [Entomophthora muscae]
MKPIYTIFISLASSLTLKEYCRQANDAHRSAFVSIALPLQYVAGQGILDCKGGKCLPDIDNAVDCKEIFLKYTHPSSKIIPSNFDDDFLTKVDSKRSFTGINFEATEKNEIAVNKFTTSFKAGSKYKETPLMLTASITSYLQNLRFYDNLIKQRRYHHIVIVSRHSYLKDGRYGHSINETKPIFFSAQNKQTASVIQKWVKNNKVYFKEVGNQKKSRSLVRWTPFKTNN